MRVIPAIDLKEGRCVRLYQGRFDRVTEYADDPSALARRYAEMGATWIHCVDLDGARAGQSVNLAAIRKITGGLPGRIQVGGGVREQRDVATLLAAGAGRVVIGSAAVEHRDEIGEWLARFGTERIVLALDVNCDDEADPVIVIRGWTQRSDLTLWRALDVLGAAGAEHILCTDVSRDGAYAGPALNLYGQCASRYPELRFQASGGVRNRADLDALAGSGADAAIVGRALLEGRIRAEELEPFLRNA
jgi:phosphoribosylformimino-5-aminoimidazole carboxamide ribotide isomerase